MRMIALALADSRTKVNPKRLNELAAMTGLHTPHPTPPEQETAWIRPIQESKVNLPLIACSIEATRQ
jgi:hypothetical protein